MIEPARSWRVPFSTSVPGDKSISHRALLFNTLAVLDSGGEACISGLLESEDVMRTMRACQQLGVRIEKQEWLWKISTGGAANGYLGIDCGNSGTTARLLLGALAGRDRVATLRGDESLSRRPMGRVIEPLTAMGAQFVTEANCLPLTLRPGPLHGVTWASKVASAQVKSAVLLAGLRASGPTTFTEPTPSRDHTERMLKTMGADLDTRGVTCTIQPGVLIPANVPVPGDISSAAFWVVAAAILERPMLLMGVGVNPTRTGCLDVLRTMGLQLRWPELDSDEPEPIRVDGGLARGAQIAGRLIPRLIDEIPVLAVAAAFAEGETVIRDAAELRVKESDRIAVMVDGLRAIGVEVQDLADGMRIFGRSGRGVHAAEVHSHGDHRIAMAFAIAGLRCGMTVRDVECVNTSYPGFLATLKRLSPGSRIAL